MKKIKIKNKKNNPTLARSSNNFNNNREHMLLALYIDLSVGMFGIVIISR